MAELAGGDIEMVDVRLVFPANLADQIEDITEYLDLRFPDLIVFGILEGRDKPCSVYSTRTVMPRWEF